MFNEGRLEALDELVSPSYVLHDAPPGTPDGPEAIRQIVTTFRTAFPDLRITIEDQIAEGEWVCSLATTRGTHRGTLFGIEPTGRTVTMTGLTLVRIADGRLVRASLAPLWSGADRAGWVASRAGRAVRALARDVEPGRR